MKAKKLEAAGFAPEQAAAIVKSVKTAAGFDPGSGMIDHLRELAAAEPFVPFTIVMRTGDKFYIRSASDIEFTHFGSPKVRSSGQRNQIGTLDKRRRWHILNVDAITEIVV